MGRNKQSQMCRPYFYNKVFFSVIIMLTCIDNYIWQILKFS